MSTRPKHAHASAVAVGIVFAALSLSAPAPGQSASDQAAAEALFRQGRDLMAAGETASACPKFAESERLDPAPGTILNLATCYDRSGLIASAWVTFKEAAVQARKANQPERSRMALDRVAELEPTLPLLTIVVPQKADRLDLQIRRDGEVVGRAEWGTPIPVDPGTHVVEASALGQRTWKTTAPIQGAGARASIEVPPLEPAQEPAPTPSPIATVGAAWLEAARSGATRAAPTALHPGSGQRTAGWVVGGVGVALLLGGGALGAVALARERDSRWQCVDGVCDSAGYSAVSDARHAATGSDVAFVAGGLLVAAGIALYWTAPRGSSSPAGSLGLAPMADWTGAGAVARGTW
ncbi:MAG: hypothetical protein ABSF69_00135 [Polyangiaceae bacterium]